MTKKDLRKAFSKPPTHFHNMVEMTLNNLTEEKEKVKMKKMTLRKGLVFAAITVLALSTTALAAGKLASITSMSNTAYKTFPTAQKISNDIGIEPQLVANFDNGFAFSIGSIATNKDRDEDGNVMREYKSVTLNYTNGNAMVIVTMSGATPNNQDAIAGDKNTYKDIELEYSSHISKSVPDDYIMTEQDKKDVESGKYTFNTGGENITSKKVHVVAWQKDNISYRIMEMGETLDQQGLLNMAYKIIDSE